MRVLNYGATVQAIFDYRAIYNSSKYQSVQPVLTDGPHYFHV